MAQDTVSLYSTCFVDGFNLKAAAVKFCGWQVLKEKVLIKDWVPAPSYNGASLLLLLPRSNRECHKAIDCFWVSMHIVKSFYADESNT